MSVVQTTTDKGQLNGTILLIVLIIHPGAATHHDGFGECHVATDFTSAVQQDHVVFRCEDFLEVSHLCIT